MTAEFGPSPARTSVPSQRGIVLFVALIMLVIISLMAVMIVRNATSSEAVNSNVRQLQLATQAAETALRYCEDAAINLINSGTATVAQLGVIAVPATTTTIALSLTHILTAPAAGTTPASVITSNWDRNSGTPLPLVVPLSTINLPGATVTYARPGECMLERLNPDAVSPFVNVMTITARGFGPEVAAADSSRTRPTGSEVWLQSTIQLR
jgi:Tfp pilus assembly protein PilX